MIYVMTIYMFWSVNSPISITPSEYLNPTSLELVRLVRQMTQPRL